MMKKHGSTILLIIILLAGLSLMLYPSVSDWWNSLHQSKVVSDYKEKVANMDNKAYEAILDKATTYNQNLAKNPNSFILKDTPELKLYNEQLNIDNTGVMGYIDIPAIDVSLPIYHSTSDAVLQVAIGHLSWSSLPVGGTTSHCVLSGHRGLPSARLFTDLDHLEKGDTFALSILDEVFTYEVDQIKTIEPDELDHLMLIDGMDYCTLTTCTPYAINSHRLLVRGHRIKNDGDEIARITEDAVLLSPTITAACIAVPALLIFVAVLWIQKLKRNKKQSFNSLN